MGMWHNISILRYLHLYVNHLNLFSSLPFDDQYIDLLNIFCYNINMEQARPNPHQEDLDYREARNQALQAYADQPEHDPFTAQIIRTTTRSDQAYRVGHPLGDSLYDIFADEEAPDEETLLSVGVDIADRITGEGVRPKTAILGYLNACYNLDTAKCAAVGPGAPTGTSLRVMDYVRKAVLESLPQDAATAKMIRLIEVELWNAARDNAELRNPLHWLYTKASLFKGEYQSQITFKEAAARLFANQKAHSPAELETAEAQTKVLTQEAMAQRKYGLKPAYTEASIGGSWIFYDADAYYMSQSTPDNPVPIKGDNAAIIFHTPLRDIRSLKLNQTSVIDDGSSKVTTAEALKDLGIDLRIYIDRQGRMSYDPEGMQPLSRILRDEPEALAALQAELAANFFDLSMPMYRQKPLPPNFKKQRQQNKTDFDPILDLVVPRIKYLKDLPTTKAETEDDHIRTVREHDVVWHVRALPEGWSASPEALENAKRNGVELAANETFVRSHKRGKDNPVLGHKVTARALV